MRPAAKVRIAVVLIVVALAADTSGVVGLDALASSTEVDISSSSAGRAMVSSTAETMRSQGFPVDEPSLHAWRLQSGAIVVADRMPINLVSKIGTDENGKESVALTYDMFPPSLPSGPQLASTELGLTATSPSWSLTSQGCFNWIYNGSGEFLTCYKFSKMVNETASRDYFSLEQYGTLQIIDQYRVGKLYDGWVSAVKNPASASMQWEEWSPDQDRNGSCAWTPISINVLGVGLNSGGVMCEVWDMTLYTDAGHFKERWSCGCVFPFGQPYPNSRAVRYLQAVSVPGGGSAIWTLSSGFSAY